MFKTVVRIISIILSFLVLQSSFGLYFTKHYCGEQFRYIIFYGETNCCDQAETIFRNGTTEHERELHSDGCCSNEHFYTSSLKAEAKIGENLNTRTMLVAEQNFCETVHQLFSQDFASTAIYTCKLSNTQPLKLPILFQAFLL